MLRDRDVNWLASQLPSWAARCASSDGSADDTTIALMISATAAVLRAGGPSAANTADGSEETTIPAVPHADTVPAQVQTEPHSTESYSTEPHSTEPHSTEPITLRQLAHRAAPEPVILERVVGPPAGHEPATTELPKVRPGQDGASDGRAGDGRAGDGRGTDDDGAGGDGAVGEDSAEPPTTRWRLPGSGGR